MDERVANVKMGKNEGWVLNGLLIRLRPRRPVR